MKRRVFLGLAAAVALGGFSATAQADEPAAACPGGSCEAVQVEYHRLHVTLIGEPRQLRAAVICFADRLWPDTPSYRGWRHHPKGRECYIGALQRCSQGRISLSMASAEARAATAAAISRLRCR